MDINSRDVHHMRFLAVESDFGRHGRAGAERELEEHGHSDERLLELVVKLGVGCDMREDDSGEVGG